MHFLVASAYETTPARAQHADAIEQKEAMLPHVATDFDRTSFVVRRHGAK